MEIIINLKGQNIKKVMKLGARQEKKKKKN